MSDEPKVKTTYVVLSMGTIGATIGTWSEVGEYQASSPETAMRLAIADKDLDESVTLVAPPKRSWKPMSRRRETKPVERLVPYSPPVDDVAVAEDLGEAEADARAERVEGAIA